MTERFIEYVRFEKRYSPHTVAAYQADLSQFFQFLSIQYQTEDVHAITQSMVRSWMVSLKEQKLSERSINRKLTTLKSFFRFLVRNSILETNPALQIRSLKTGKRLPVFLDQEKTKILFEEVDFGEGYEGLRNRVIVELLYATGIRLSELVNLNEEDIDSGLSSIKVLGKRNKERLIPFGKMMERLFLEYLDLKHQKFSSREALFLTKTGERIYPKLVYRLVHDTLGKISTITKRSPHILRHTFATHLLNNGAELKAVKELLGHSSLAATQVYTHNAIEQLKKIYEQAHPKA